MSSTLFHVVFSWYIINRHHNDDNESDDDHEDERDDVTDNDNNRDGCVNDIDNDLMVSATVISDNTR